MKFNAVHYAHIRKERVRFLRAPPGRLVTHARLPAKLRRVPKAGNPFKWAVHGVAADSLWIYLERDDLMTMQLQDEPRGSTQILRLDLLPPLVNKCTFHANRHVYGQNFCSGRNFDETFDGADARVAKLDIPPQASRGRCDLAPARIDLGHANHISHFQPAEYVD